MALTRKMLSGMGLTAEQVDAIIEEHVSVTDGLKAQRDEYKEKADEYKEKADKVPDLEKELNDLKTSASKDDWQGKYNKEHEDFEAYKKDIEGKEALSKVKEAYKKLLTTCKVGDKQIDAVMKVTDFSGMKLDGDGNLENAEELQKDITTTWSGFITNKETKGADVDNPPGGNGAGGAKPSRAAELAAKYNENLYGKTKED